uniref:Fanconi anemia group F protein n=1 Tax=Euleptes europaea TaxID=460621 RepID=UPI002540019B|nr:Fanconi anemia group F protein [Euleptes europaea]
METLLSQAEQLPGLLAASRSGLVRGWDAATLQRALAWGRFSQQLHGQPALRAALERRLGRRFSLRRCPELLGLALLGNRALPPAAYQRLLRGLLSPGGRDADPFVPLLARRRAAAQLLSLPWAPPTEEASAGDRGTPQLRAQAQLLLSRLREEEEEEGGGGGGAPAALLDRLPRGPVLYRAAAAALLEPSGEAQAAAPLLLRWLLRGDPARLPAFCRLLPAPWVAALCGRHPELRARCFGLLDAWGSRLSYDWRRGGWTDGGLGEGEDRVTWRELRELVGGLLRGPEPLRGDTAAQLKRLKARDGDFEVRGLSVWTDLLLDVGTEASGGRWSVVRAS